METYYLLVFTTRIQWKPPNRFPIEFGGAKVWQHRHFIFKIRFPTAAIFADSIHIYIYIRIIHELSIKISKFHRFSQQKWHPDRDQAPSPAPGPAAAAPAAPLRPMSPRFKGLTEHISESSHEAYFEMTNTH